MPCLRTLPAMMLMLVAANSARGEERVENAAVTFSFVVPNGNAIPGSALAGVLNRVLLSAAQPDSILGNDGFCAMNATEFRSLGADLMVLGEMRCSVFSWTGTALSLTPEVLAGILERLSARAGMKLEGHFLERHQPSVVVTN